jgi:hypothetical protein
MKPSSMWRADSSGGSSENSTGRRRIGMMRLSKSRAEAISLSHTGLLDCTSWLPEPLRLRVADASGSPDAGEPEELSAFLTGDARAESRVVATE